MSEINSDEIGQTSPKNRPRIRFKPISEAPKLKAELARVTENSQTDLVTGLPNDRAFDSFIKGLEDLYQRDSNKDIHNRGSFVVLDLSGLHETNDRYGKLAGGDDYLRSVANSVSENARPGDRYFRLGTHADELVLHLHDVVNPEDLGSVMDRIDLRLHEYQEQYQNKYPGIKFGVSYSVASHGSKFSPKMAYEVATNKLGLAKTSKDGNRVGDVGRLFVNEKDFI